MWKFALIWITDMVLFESTSSLKNVALTIDPSTVERGNRALLQCAYDLEGDHLYSVKWYRGTHEFYRHTPSEMPSTKVFATSDIIVDEARSNSTQVSLINIDFPLSGKFTCEVTTEMPLSIRTDTRTMLVVQLPADPPKISVTRKPLDYGDLLQANCTSSPSRPPAKLTFSLNGYQVAKSPTLSPREAANLNWSDLMLDMKLGQVHFRNGRLILQCRAEVENVYDEEAVLKLESVREPVPERVSAESRALFISPENCPLQVIVLFYIFFVS